VADRNLEIALRIKADLESARKQLDDLSKSVKATGDNSQASAAKLGAVSDRIGEMEQEAAGLNKTLGQTDKVTQSAATSSSTLGREVAQLASNLGHGNFTSAAGNITRIGTASGVTAESAGLLSGSVGGVVAVLALLAVGSYKGYQETERLRVSVIATGGAAGESVADFDDMAVAVGKATDQYGNARKAVELLASSGKVAGAGISGLAKQAVDMATVTGQSVDQAVAKIIEIGDRPTAAIAKLNEQYHFLTAAQYAQIAALEAEGNTRAAGRLANQLDAQAMADRAKDVQDNAGLIERAAHSVKAAWDEAWDSIKGIGRTQGLGDQAVALEAQIKALTTPHTDRAGNLVQGQFGDQVADLQRQLAEINRQRTAAGFASQAQELDARGNADSIAAQQRTAQFLPADVKRDNALKQANADRLAKMYGVVDPDQKALIERTYQNQVKAANDAYAAATKVPKTPKGPTAPDNTKQALAAQQDLITMLQQLQGQLDPTAAAWAKYNATVDQATAKAALAKQAKGANIAGIDAERTAVVQLAAVMRDAQLDAIAKKDRDAWEQLRASLRTPAEVKVETASAQIAELNRLIAAGVDVGGKYQQTLDAIVRNSIVAAPQYQGVDAAVSGPAGELIKAVQAGQALDLWHTQQLASNEAFRQQDIANEQAANARKLQIEKDFADKKKAIDQAKNQLAVDTAVNGFGVLASAMQSAYGEQSKQYRIAFALQKASALASAILSIQKSIAASSEIGYPWNIVSIAGAVAQGVGVLATINSTSLGGYSEGGYTGPGAKHQPAGVVHAGEVVWSQRDISRAGGVSTVEAMRLGMRGYADGGRVNPMASAPAAPGFAPIAAPAITPAAGAGQAQQINQRIVVGLDTSVLDDWANSSSFEKAVKVTISRNPSFVRQTVSR
jgi:phage-related minor tail protein